MSPPSRGNTRVAPTTASAPFLSGVHAVPNGAPLPAAEIMLDEDGHFGGRLQASDPEGSPLRFDLLPGARGSGIVLAEDGTLDSRPAADFSGTEEFRVRVSDGQGGSTVSLQRMVVTPVDDPPVNRLAFSTLDFGLNPRVGRERAVVGEVTDPDGLQVIVSTQWLRDAGFPDVRERCAGQRGAGDDRDAAADSGHAGADRHRWSGRAVQSSRPDRLDGRRRRRRHAVGGQRVRHPRRRRRR